MRELCENGKDKVISALDKLSAVELVPRKVVSAARRESWIESGASADSVPIRNGSSWHAASGLKLVQPLPATRLTPPHTPPSADSKSDSSHYYFGRKEKLVYASASSGTCNVANSISN